MDRIDFNQPGGFPLSTQILDAAQEAYKTFNAYGQLAGELAIITGCTDINVNEVSDGFVSINGELLPFKSATKSQYVVIVENADQRGFEDGSVKPVIYKRYVTFGSSDVQFEWANFRRPLTLFQLEDRLKLVEKTVPVGLVAIWGRSAAEIPMGWEEHTELAGLVPVGHKPGDVNFGALDSSLGAAQVSLTVNNLPSFSISLPSQITIGGSNSGTGGNQNTVLPSYTQRTATFTGNNQPLSNIQPSRIVKYIRFVGFNF
ncbi:hypothetical protein [Chryseobacterium sp. T1]